MEWVFLLVGAALGVAAQQAYDWIKERYRTRARASAYKNLNRSTESLRKLYGHLELVQTGWAPDGSFAQGSVLITVRSNFQTPAGTITLRERLRSDWSSQGAVDSPQIGLRSYRVDRLTDSPEEERTGLSHRLRLVGHEYPYFDFLATHIHRLTGPDAELELATEASRASHQHPSPDFPTPLSVGLALLAEDGDWLMLMRRATSASHASNWAGGLIFNAVGEGIAPRDLGSAGHPADTTSPQVTAARGLYEECGWLTEHLSSSAISIHSFAFDNALLDFKFFGTAVTSMSRHEVEQLWQAAPDRSESSGFEWVPVDSNEACSKLIRRIQTERDQWSDEAVFATVRTLLFLGRLGPDVAATARP